MLSSELAQFFKNWFTKIETQLLNSGKYMTVHSSCAIVVVNVRFFALGPFSLVLPSLTLVCVLFMRGSKSYSDDMRET